MTPDGEAIVSIPDASRPAWFDVDRFFAYRHSTIPVPTTPGGAPGFLGSIASGELVEIEAPFGSALSNGHGAVALARLSEPSGGGGARPDYIIWNGGDKASEPNAGSPNVWSSTGEMLAVLHPVNRAHSSEGWVEVVSWPNLDSVFEDGSRTVANEAWFDPTGDHVAFTSVTGEGTGPFEYFINVVDLTSLDTVRIPIDDHTDFRWNSSGEIVALSGHESIDTYSPGGELINSEAVERFWIIEASNDSSTLVFYEGEDDLTISIGTLGALVDVELPEGLLSGVELSPTGNRVAVLMANPQSTNDNQVLYLRDL